MVKIDKPRRNRNSAFLQITDGKDDGSALPDTRLMQQIYRITYKDDESKQLADHFQRPNSNLKIFYTTWRKIPEA